VLEIITMLFTAPADPCLRVTYAHGVAECSRSFGDAASITEAFRNGTLAGLRRAAIISIRVSHTRGPQAAETAAATGGVLACLLVALATCLDGDMGNIRITSSMGPALVQALVQGIADARPIVRTDNVNLMLYSQLEVDVMVSLCFHDLRSVHYHNGRNLVRAGFKLAAEAKVEA